MCSALYGSIFRRKLIGKAEAEKTRFEPDPTVYRLQVEGQTTELSTVSRFSVPPVYLFPETATTLICRWPGPAPCVDSRSPVVCRS